MGEKIQGASGLPTPVLPKLTENQKAAVATEIAAVELRTGKTFTEQERAASYEAEQKTTYLVKQPAMALIQGLGPTVHKLTLESIDCMDVDRLREINAELGYLSSVFARKILYEAALQLQAKGLPLPSYPIIGNPEDIH